MRTIKFRGKRVDSGEWVYGYLLGTRDRTEAWITDSYYGTHYRVIPETVGQMISKIKRENGDEDEIFEGDLIIHGERILKVMCLSGNTSLMDKGNKTAILLSFNNGKVKVGNVHDNPELITN